MQNAFVVEDLDATLEHWTTKMGVGPFYVFEHVTFQEAYFRGKPCAIDMTAAIGYWGDMQIELIKQHDAVPSIYTEFTAAGQRGMHHMGVVTPDLDAHLQRLRELGITPVQWGVMPTGMRFAYVNSDFHPGGMIELIETVPAIADYFEVMKDAAARWDGSDPIIRV